jgi:hypothetical protein
MLAFENVPTLEPAFCLLGPAATMADSKVIQRAVIHLSSLLFLLAADWQAGRQAAVASRNECSNFIAFPTCLPVRPTAGDFAAAAKQLPNIPGDAAYDHYYSS